MIEGYSVDEAASVLGVPKGRVWELLARGVLAGTPEDGGGMRVYLQGRPMEPIVGRPPESRHGGSAERPASANGNGGEHGQPGFEASPFRELLTEFRNLTERYGQALLALGEARGEVASLRTRVELLEARVDLRLPSAPPLVQWSPPAQPLDAPQAEIEPEPNHQSLADELEGLQSASREEPEPAEAEPVAQAAADDEPTTKTTRSRRRRRAARLATEGFAEALARAQDPTASQLPGGQDAQAAFNELRERIRRESHGGKSPEAAAGRTDEPGDASGFDDFTAPAQEVELDSFLADEELGGGVEQATVAEVVVSDDAEPIEQFDLQEAEPIHTAEAIQHVEQSEEAEPMQTAAEFAEPADTAEPVAEAEPVEPIVEDTSVSREPEPVVEATAEVPRYSHEWDEPDWIAEEDVDWSTDESASPPEPVAMGESPEMGWDELPAATAPASPEPMAEDATDEPADESEASEPPMSAFTPVDAPEPEPAAPSTERPPTSQPIQVEAVGSSPDPSAPAAPVDVSADAPQAENPTSAQASEEELMWLGDEFRAGPSTRGLAGRVTTIPKPSTSLAVPDVGVSPAEDEALSRLAVERGWDDEELRAIRSLLAQPGRPALEEADFGVTATKQLPPRAEPTNERAQDLAEHTAKSVDAEPREEEAFDWEQGPPAWNPPPMARAPRELPGAVELDQAMAAFEVGAWSKQSTERRDEPTPEPAAGQPGGEIEAQAQAPQPPTSPEPASNAILQEAEGPEPQERSRQEQTPAPEAPSSVTLSEPYPGGETDWLRGRRGPAANAYRRLRRLFP